MHVCTCVYELGAREERWKKRSWGCSEGDEQTEKEERVEGGRKDWRREVGSSLLTQHAAANH